MWHFLLFLLILHRIIIEYNYDDDCYYDCFLRRSADIGVPGGALVGEQRKAMEGK